MLVVDVLRCYPLYGLPSVLLISLPRSICGDVHLLGGVYLSTETNKLNNGVPRCLILPLSHDRLIRRTVRLVVVVRLFEVGKVVYFLRLHHIIVDISPLHVIHERVGVREE